MNLKLSKSLSMPAIDYAGQGNAIIGIRDAGKTYTAMKAAEQLLDAGIPIIVYDPVGVWKNLKNGIGTHPGYQVVVAGGEGSDILLTPANAVDIVRAAMKENISLVIDLYSPELINKSTWIKVVQETVDLLMYENKTHSMRHIFLEEAAEFIPQRLQPQHARVYASIERLARMGRNAKLGMTIINQRAEEVNKAILEICAFSLLHKQVGKNSLLSIQKWLEISQVPNSKDIIKSLPGLKQGECWAIGHGQADLITVAARNTFHPNPKVKDSTVKARVADVNGFVERLKTLLQKPEPSKPAKSTEADKSQVELLKQQINQLKGEVRNFQEARNTLNEEINKAHKVLQQIHSLTSKYSAGVVMSQGEQLAKQPALKPVANVVTFNPPIPTKHKIVVNAGDKKLAKCPLAILQFLGSYKRSFSKAQVGVVTGYSPNSGGFNNALSDLTTKGLITREGGKLACANIHTVEEWTGELDNSRQYSATTFKDKLGKCEREIYEVLLENPYDIFSKESLASRTPSQYSYNSGGFNNALSTLSTLELIERSNGAIKLNPELIELL